MENNETVIGPLVSPIFNDSDKKAYDKALLHQVQTKVNMTKDHIHKILLAFTLLKSEQIASAEFADIIGVTIRSANRILKRAEEVKLVYSTIDDSSGLQGCPRKLYRLNKEIIT